MDQKQVLDRWLLQLENNEISSDAIGLRSDKEQAIQHLRQELVKSKEMEKNQAPSNL